MPTYGMFDGINILSGYSRYLYILLTKIFFSYNVLGKSKDKILIYDCKYTKICILWSKGWHDL